jgi:hypothetical protein
MNLLDLEFLAIASERYRYPLEKNGHGRKHKRCKQDRIHTNVFERYPILKCTKQKRCQIRTSFRHGRPRRFEGKTLLI